MDMRSIRRAGFLAALAAVSIGVAGCGTTTAGGDSADGGVVYRDENGECASPPLEGIDYDTASELVAYFEEESTGLPVSDPLPEAIDPATTVTYLHNGSAVAAIMAAALEQAADTAGVRFQIVDTGLDAQSIDSAVGTVTENAPDILISAAVDATFYQNHLAALEQAGTTVVYAGQSNGEEFGLLDSHSGLGASIVNGDVLAAAAIAFTCGTSTDFVFYRIPELRFSDIQLDAANAYLEEVCADCTLRVVDIPVATMDTTAGDAIISDLQANPDTSFFITPADQMQIGLKAKQDLAGLDVPGMGQSSLPPNIEQIASGLQLAGYAVDYDEYSWFLLDEGLRRHQGVEVAYGDWLPWVKAISRIVTQSSASEYPNGFVAYPDMAEDFATLWGK